MGKRPQRATRAGFGVVQGAPVVPRVAPSPEPARCNHLCPTQHHRHPRAPGARGGGDEPEAAKRGVRGV